MNPLLDTLNISPALLAILIVLIIWEMIWKGIALWKSGRNNQIAWFIVILLINSIGILPILYILFFQKKSKKRK